jgi:hypothetical protein
MNILDMFFLAPFVTKLQSTNVTTVVLLFFVNGCHVLQNTVFCGTRKAALVALERFYFLVDFSEMPLQHDFSDIILLAKLTLKRLELLMNFVKVLLQSGSSRKRF